MDERLRVLLIEDSADDYRRIVAELEGGGLTVEHERVCSREQIEQSLEGRAWDIVLADYAMPGFTALDALLIVKRQTPDTPFVLVSGAIGEETAALLMRTGARDCIMKDNLGRLVPVVQRELREAHERVERRRLDSVLRETQERASKIVDTAASLILTLDSDFVITDCNGRAHEFLGYGREQLLGRSMADLIEDSALDDARRVFQSCLKADGVSVHDCRLVRRDGGIIDVMVSCTSLRDDEGKPAAVLYTMNDITMRKLAEERLRQDEEREGLINRLLLISLSEELIETQLQKALEQLASIEWLQVERGAVLLCDESSDTLELWVAHGAPAEILSSCDRLERTRCVCYRAVAEKRLQWGCAVDDCPGLRGGLEAGFAVYAVPIL
ncbi:MAG: PAS domain S-box protein, partial [Chitinivibrionales bacterium]|nr:PAS domain S-box protein [Chitinivibrionales bacterium]